MPAVSQSQAKFFRWAEHNPAEAKREGKYPKGMTTSQMHDYSATPNAGLPERAPKKHMEDGGTGPRFFRWLGHSTGGDTSVFPSGHAMGDVVHRFAQSTDRRR